MSAPATKSVKESKRNRVGASERRERPVIVDDAPSLAPRRHELSWTRWLIFIAGLLSLASGLLLYAAQPPLDLWPFAWIAPAGWLLLVIMPRLAGIWSYLAIWATGFLHWMLVLQGIRHAHWAVWIGWFVLSAYLAIYLPLFVGLTRVAVHRLKWPLALAAPVVWTALEFARGLGFSGFSGALLGHTQVGLAPLIQVADFGGAYAVSFVVMFVAACLVSAMPTKQKPFSWKRSAIALGAATSLLAATFAYGRFRLTETNRPRAEQSLEVALVQSAYDTVLDGNPRDDLRNFDRALAQSLAAAREHGELDLIVWPESAYTGDLPDMTYEGKAKPPAESDLSPEEFAEALQNWSMRLQSKARFVSRSIARGNSDARQAPALIAGSTGRHYDAEGDDILNSALWINSEGKIAGRYHKNHPVMFGEYVPLGETFPWLYRLMPMPRGLTPGPGPSAFAIDGLIVSPSICFESVVPQLIRRHGAELAAKGKPPDVLVNVTNDGWFHGSSILDIHLACGVFRAIENRAPLLISANGGPTAIVDSDGRIQQIAPRRRETVVVGTVRADGRRPLYRTLGDSPWVLCLACCVGLAAVGMRQRRRDKAIAALARN